MLYPLSWSYTRISVLPESMSTILEAPMPFIIGYNQDIKELTPDVIKVNLDYNRVTINEPLPKLPFDFHKYLCNRLKTLVNFSSTAYDPILANVDQAFTVMLVDPDEQVEFDWLGIRNAMVEFMITLLRDYQKFVVVFIIIIDTTCEQRFDIRIK